MSSWKILLLKICKTKGQRVQKRKGRVYTPPFSFKQPPSSNEHSSIQTMTRTVLIKREPIEKPPFHRAFTDLRAKPPSTNTY